MSDRDLVEICLQELRRKSGYGDAGTLIQRDIEYLCADIAEKTNVHISSSTIKRLFNGQYSRLPQVATLDAITFYLGYDNWQDFRIKNKHTNGHALIPGSNGAAANASNGKPVTAKKRLIPFNYTSIGIVIAILVVSLLLVNYFFAAHTPDYSHVTFSFRKTTSNDIPNTVVFNYNVDNIAGDSFFIQQSWDVKKRVRIYKNNYTLTDIYYEPGFHNATLIVNDKVVKTVGVSIPADDWFFYSNDRGREQLPVYIKPAQPVKNGILGLQPEDIINSNIDTLQERKYIYSLFPSVYSVSSDNFILSTRIRMKRLNNTLCPTIMCEVGCETNFLYFNLTTPGCTGSIHAQFGEQWLSGKTNDLSGFGCDVTGWQRVELAVMDKTATVYINEKEIFSKPYSQSSGLITGLAFISNGLCEIDAVELTGLDGKVVYKNSF